LSWASRGDGDWHSRVYSGIIAPGPSALDAAAQAVERSGNRVASRNRSAAVYYEERMMLLKDRNGLVTGGA